MDCNDNSSGPYKKQGEINAKELEFVEELIDLFKLPIDFLQWSKKNIEDWFYWNRHRLRLKYPKISKEIIDFNEEDPTNKKTWSEKFGPAGFDMYKVFTNFIKNSMKAIRISEFGEPCVLKLIENLSIPRPADNEILIEVKYAGVNPVDTYRRSGKYNPLPALPWIPGSDCSGIVLQTGANVQNKFSIGQRVFTTSTIGGSYTSHALANINHVHSLPDNLSFQQGAALGIPYFTAYSALFDRGEAKSGETVLIHGASGAVGIASIQMAKANGLTVIGTAGTQEGLEMIKKIGADYVFNHRQDRYIDEIKEKFPNKINLVIEMLANQNLVSDCEIVAFKGRIMIVGNRGTINFDPRLTMGKLLDIRGVALGVNTIEQWQESASNISKWMENGYITPVISKEYDLIDAPKAHHDVIFNSGSMGKLVLKI